MPGLWKAWKAKSRLPTLSTSPLEISPTAGRDSHISTAPATTAAGNVQNQKQVFHVPTATDPRSPRTKKHGRGTGFALRPAAGTPCPA
jgi:hypothetical protein